MELPRNILAAVLATVPLLGAPDGARDGGVERTAGPRSGSALSTVAFEENRGQTDPRVRFLARARGVTAFLTDDAAVLSLGRARERRETAVLRIGAGTPARPAATGAALPGPAHYLLGKDPANWVRDVPRHASVRSAGVAPGADLVWRGGEGGRLRFDLHLAAGVDPASVPIAVEGARSLTVDAAGRLVAALPGGTLALSRPRLWQEAADGRRPVSGRFVVRGSAAVVEAGTFDRSLPLVVDPTLEYGSFLGGTLADDGKAAALGPQNSLVVAGTAASTNFPLMLAYDSTNNGGAWDIAVARISSDGQSLEYATYVGGSNVETPYDLAVASGGQVVVCGESSSSNFPVVNAVQSTPSLAAPVGIELYPRPEGIAFRIAADGGSLEWSTYLGGGTDTDAVHAVAIDGSGDAFLAGETSSTAFPLLSAIQGTKGTGRDAFVCRIGPTGTLGWSTFLGGNGDDAARALRIHSSGALLVAGSSASSNFPRQNAFQTTLKGTSDAFVLRMPATGVSLTWSSYLGGNSNDVANAIAEGPGGVTWVAGESFSSDFPTVANAPQPNYIGGGDAFLARIAADGATQPFGSYLGGSFNDSARGLAVDALGAVYMAGETVSPDFYVTANALDGSSNGANDMFVARFRPNGIGLLYSSYLGSSNDEFCESMLLDPAGGIWLVGSTTSSTFPTQSPLDGTLGGASDWAIARVRLDLPAAPPSLIVNLGAPGNANLVWQDGTGGLCPHEIERQAGFGMPFVPIATNPPGPPGYADATVPTDKTVTWRVRAVDHSGPSAWTASNPVSTPPFPPQAPTGLAATVLGPTTVRLTWTDNSDREDEVLVYRRDPADVVEVAATAAANAVSIDAPGRPDRAYEWFVEAVNEGGTSGPSVEVAAATPASFALALKKGKLKYSLGLEKDLISIKAVMGPGPGGTVPVLNPAANGFELRVGGRDEAPFFAIPPGDPGWKVKKTTYSWKSAKGAFPKVKIVINGKKGSIAASVSVVDIPATTASSMFVGVDCGPAQASSTVDAWTQKVTGERKYP